MVSEGTFLGQCHVNIDSCIVVSTVIQISLVVKQIQLKDLHYLVALNSYWATEINEAWGIELWLGTEMIIEAKKFKRIFRKFYYTFFEWVKKAIRSQLVQILKTKYIFHHCVLYVKLFMTIMKMKNRSQYKIWKHRDGRRNNAYKIFTSRVGERNIPNYPMWNCSWLPWKWKMIFAIDGSIKCKKTGMEDRIRPIKSLWAGWRRAIFQTQYPMWNCSLPSKWKITSAMDATMKCREDRMEGE